MPREIRYTITVVIKGEVDAEAIQGQLMETIDEFKDETEAEFECQVETIYTCTEQQL